MFYFIYPLSLKSIKYSKSKNILNYLTSVTVFDHAFSKKSMSYISFTI